MTDNKPDFHQPQHPLPEEIRKMRRDETVCKYCGVSYLIHREIKALQDQLKAVTKELEHYKGLEIREKQLQDEINQKNQRISEVEELVNQRDAVVSELQSQVKDLASSVANETKARKELENKLAEGASNLKQVRMKNQLLIDQLPSIKEDILVYKNSMKNIKIEIRNNQDAMKTFTQTKMSDLLNVCQKITNERLATHSEISRLKSQIENSSAAESDLQRKMTLTQQEAERLKSAEGQLVTQLKIDIEESQKRESDLKDQLFSMSSKVKEMQTSMKDYEKRIMDENSKYKGLSFELEQLKTKLSHKEQEINALTSQLRNKDIMHEQNKKKLENVIAQRESSLHEKTKAWDELRKKLHEQERQEKIALQQANATSVQANDLKSELNRVRKDCDALKAEREMMIVAHQNQIQDLRNSFRQKMEEMQGWPDKLDRALRQERNKHKQELENLELNFKENFTMELEIEKQKFETMYSKNLSQLKDEEVKAVRRATIELRAEISAIQARHRAEVTDLHKQTADAKTRSRDNENALRQEVTGLKRIIAELEGRLCRLDSGDSATAISLKTRIKELERKIEEQNGSYNELQHTYDTSKEQIAFLEETVRKECEERFELTETLSAAKEELLLLKRPSGGYTSLNRSAASTPTRRNSELVDALHGKSNEDLTPFQKSTSLKSLNAGPPHPPSKPKDGTTDNVTSNSLQMDFVGDRVKTPNTGVRGGNVSSRR